MVKIPQHETSLKDSVVVDNRQYQADPFTRYLSTQNPGDRFLSIANHGARSVDQSEAAAIKQIGEITHGLEETQYAPHQASAIAVQEQHTCPDLATGLTTLKHYIQHEYEVSGAADPPGGSSIVACCGSIVEPPVEATPVTFTCLHCGQLNDIPHSDEVSTSHQLPSDEGGHLDSDDAGRTRTKGAVSGPKQNGALEDNGNDMGDFVKKVAGNLVRGLVDGKPHMGDVVML